MIKFRAWDKRRKEMWKVATLHIEDEYADLFKTNIYENPFNDPWAKFEDLILMQSTGLKDKNGVEIFEGDILKCASRIYTNLGATGTGEYEETIKQVIWKDDSWGTRVISSNLTSKGAEKSGLVIPAKYAEIIGNIYENPELLEVSE
mgnify:CR=1 FL=1